MGYVNGVYNYLFWGCYLDICIFYKSVIYNIIMKSYLWFLLKSNYIDYLSGCENDVLGW